MKFNPGEIYYNTTYGDTFSIVKFQTDNSHVYVINLINKNTDYFGTDSIYANNLVYLGTDLSAVKLQYPEYFI